MNKLRTVCWLFTALLVSALVLPLLIQDGMFMDAMLYTSVAHNLANDAGTFWFPVFSYHNVHGLGSFHEQPPLVFGIQSLFFEVFGSSRFVERFYVLVTVVMTTLLIALSWRRMFGESAKKQFDWLPVLLWIIIPVCFWSFSQNMHENTMGVFILAAFLSIIHALTSERTRFIYLVPAALFISLAVLSKGIPGFFPLAIPVIYGITLKRNRTWCIKETLFLTLTTAAMLGSLFLFEDSSRSLTIYLKERLLYRLGNDPLVESRFFIVRRLIEELLPAIGVAVMLKLATLKTVRQKVNYRLAAFFLFTGLAGVLPLMLTLVQRTFYFVPALPFFALALAVWCYPSAEVLLNKLNKKRKALRATAIIISAALAGCAILTVSLADHVKRDRELLHDVYLIKEAIPEERLLTVKHETMDDWSLQTYLIRYNFTSLSPDVETDYLLLPKGTTPGNEHYQSAQLPTLKYDLYRRKK